MSESRSELSLCCARTILPLPPAPEPPPWKLCQARLSPSARASRPVGQDTTMRPCARSAPAAAARAPTVRDLYLSGGPGALDGSPATLAGVIGTRGVLRGVAVATFRHPKIVKRNSFDVSSDRKKMARRRAPPRLFRGVLQPGNSRNPRPSPSAHAFRPSPFLLPSLPGAEMESSGGGREGRPGPGGRGEGWRQGDERVVLAGKDTLALTAFTVIHSRRCRNLPGRDALSRPDGNTVWSVRPRADGKYFGVIGCVNVALTLADCVLAKSERVAMITKRTESLSSHTF